MTCEPARECAAKKALFGAEVFITIETIAALAAADPGEYGFLGADQILRNVGPDFLDDAGDLVPQGKRQRHAARGIELLAATEIGVAVLDMQVRVAQSA